jgi:hypothetical protein
MGMQEEQADKVVIQAAQSAHCKRHENDGIWTISVQSPIGQDLRPDRVFKGAIRRGARRSAVCA